MEGVKYFDNPQEGVLRLFVMSIGEFIDVYNAFEDTVSVGACMVQ